MTMKNSIIWNPYSYKRASKIIWDLLQLPILLTTLDTRTIAKEYYDKTDDMYYPLYDKDEDVYGLEKAKLLNEPEFETISHIKVKYCYGGDWRLIQPKNLKSLTDLLRIINDTEDSLTIFTNDVDIKTIEQWVESKVNESYITKKVFLPNVEFANDPVFLKNICKLTILEGFLSFLDNDNYFIISNDTKSLEKIMESAEHAGERRQPDYTDSLSFKKSFDSAIFFTDLDLVIKNRRNYLAY